MGTGKQNGKRDTRGESRPAEGEAVRPVAVATSSYVNIIEALLENGSMSRSELASSIGLSRSALTEMSRVLIQHQFVEESPAVIDKQGRGRPSIMLSLNARYGYFVGVGLTEDPPLMALTDCHGNVLAEHEITAEMEPEAVAAAIAKGIPYLTRASNISREKVLGIGVALSGHVNHARGTCLQSNLLGWHDVPIARIVERVTGMPTYIDNDAHAVALGQKLFGMARELKSFMVIMLGKKIGGGSYMQGRLYRGNTGAAGEIGHCTVVPSGPRCECGKQGCVDVFASSSALLRRAGELNLQVREIGELEALAAKGSREAIELLQHAGSVLGIAVANSIQVNNPELVLFADLVGFGNRVFTNSARQTIESNIMPHLLSTTRLEFRSVEMDFLVRGAASIAAHQFLIERAG
ncbi:MAG TPA: ROK family transcriptional regulator [Acidobacteriaceae bacterium]|nr:ROK family transcriptional regulator [Acidobacteriaceae bacterium]